MTTMGSSGETFYGWGRNSRLVIRGRPEVGGGRKWLFQLVRFWITMKAVVNAR